MKTYEIMERIDKLGKEMLNKEYKLIDKNSNFAIDISEGEIATIREFAAGEGFLALTNEGVRIAYLTGFEEWEEVKEPVGFMEAVKSGKKIRSVTWMQNTELDLPNLLYDMSDFDEEEIRQLLLGKWYIENE